MAKKWAPYWSWFRFSLLRLVKTRRFAALTFLLTVTMFSLSKWGRMDPSESAALLLLVLIPVLALFFGGGAIRGELQRESLTFILARPLTRWGIYVARVGAAAVACALMVLPALLFGTGGTSSSAFTYALAAFPSAFGYTFIFALLAQWSSRPLWLSLSYLLFWEAPLSRVPGFLGRTTIATHVRAIADLPTKDALLSTYWEAPPASLSLVVLVVVVGAAATVGARRLTLNPSRSRRGIEESGL